MSHLAIPHPSSTIDRKPFAQCRYYFNSMLFVLAGTAFLIMLKLKDVSDFSCVMYLNPPKAVGS